MHCSCSSSLQWLNSLYAVPLMTTVSGVILKIPQMIPTAVVYMKAMHTAWQAARKKAPALGLFGADPAEEAEAPAACGAVMRTSARPATMLSASTSTRCSSDVHMQAYMQLSTQFWLRESMSTRKARVRAARKSTHSMGHTMLVSFATPSASTMPILPPASASCARAGPQQRPQVDKKQRRKCTTTCCSARTRVHVKTLESGLVASEPRTSPNSSRQQTTPATPKRAKSMAIAPRAPESSSPVPRLPV
mmetsp:Transcript_53510/g.148368  ORF Transcript_53510/g.148368 Transcript_53510/m.148368 type:complete len:248 (+) Transcript_53510:30-773(+)